MSNVRFIGCLHFGHKAMAQYRGFQDEYYHDEHLIESWNKVVRKKDLVFITGDITFESPEYYYQLDRLNGRKKVILGNHDRIEDVPELLKYVEGVAGMFRYKGYFLTHAPIHPNELSFCKGNIHAHIHHRNKLDELETKIKYGDEEGTVKSLDKYFNVDAHLIDYKPITLQELIK